MCMHACIYSMAFIPMINQRFTVKANLGSQKKIAKSEDLLNYYCWSDLARCAVKI